MLASDDTVAVPTPPVAATPFCVGNTSPTLAVPETPFCVGNTSPTPPGEPTPVT